MGAAAVLVLAASLVVIGSVRPADAAAEPGLRFESTSTFLVDPAGGAVHVTVDITVTNTQPDQVSNGVVRQFYFPKIGVPVLAEATSFAAARADGHGLAVTEDAAGSDAFKIAVVDLAPDLFYRQTQVVHLAYDLPNLPPRAANGFTRVNSAFLTFAAWGVGDPGLVTVKIIVPDSFEIDLVGDAMESEQHDGETFYTETGIMQPDLWGVVLAGRNEDALVAHPLTVDGHAIDIKQWPGDDEWGGFVDSEVQAGLPTLEKLVGEPWPTAGQLEIVENATPYLYGYAGWYAPDTNRIEIGDALDATVIFHEISHVWFNNRIFSARWISEAFAQEYATRTLEQIGQPLQSPGPVTSDDPGAIRLNAWSKPSVQDVQSEAQEAYGYNASWTVVRGVSDEVGTDALARVIAAATQGVISYEGDGKPERTDKTADWKRLLDLFENFGGSVKAEDLFTQYVIEDSDASLLRDRATARETYDALVKRGDGWSAPFGLRLAMSHWSFDRATDLDATATKVLDTRDELTTTLDGSGLDIPVSLEHDYETASSDNLAGVVDEAQHDLDAAKAVTAAQDAEAAPRNIWTRIGLLGVDVGRHVDDAGTAFERGDAPTAVTDAHDATTILDQADTVGQHRVELTAGVIGLVVLVLIGGRKLVRRRRRARLVRATTDDEAGCAELIES